MAEHWEEVQANVLQEQKHQRHFEEDEEEDEEENLESLNLELLTSVMNRNLAEYHQQLKSLPSDQSSSDYEMRLEILTKCINRLNDENINNLLNE